jgi:hypothetical protein
VFDAVAEVDFVAVAVVAVVAAVGIAVLLEFVVALVLIVVLLAATGQIEFGPDNLHIAEPGVVAELVVVDRCCNFVAQTLGNTPESRNGLPEMEVVVVEAGMNNCAGWFDIRWSTSS